MWEFNSRHFPSVGIELPQPVSIVSAYKFKMEGLDQVVKLILLGDSMFTVDLKDGYYHMNMSQQAIPYMGLQFYAYVVLPFGLAISPLVFCKIIWAIITHLRKKGHRILAYLNPSCGPLVLDRASESK